MIIKGQQFDRTFSLEMRSEGESKVFHASLSSEQPVRRMFGTEILSHAEGAVNFDRAGRGLPLLFNHDMDAPIGRVSDIRLDGDKLRGVLKFSPHSEMGQRIEREVADGFLGDVSIRYSIDEYETVTDKKSNTDTITVTRWTPLEASIVTVPADSSVGVGRSKEGHDMTTATTATGGDDGGGNVNVVAFQEARRAAQAAGEATGAQKERERIALIDEVFAPFAARGEDFGALKAECIRKGSSPEQARASLLTLISATPDATPSATRKVADDEGKSAGRPMRIEAGRTSGEKFAEGATRALLARAGVEKLDDQRGKNELLGLSLSEMARAWCSANGLRAPDGTNDLIRYVLGEGRRDAVGLGTVDFTGIMANVASKSLFAGWEENPSTWRQWCRIGSVPDFKRANRTGLSGADLLDKVPENAEYTRGDLTDRTEYMTAYKYGKLFAFTREAIKNDDLQALSAVPRKMGRAADLTVNKTVYDLLCSASGVGPTLNQDSTALFRTTGKPNYVSSGGAINVASLEVGRRYMALQVDPNNSMPLNIQPKYLLAPATAVTTARVLVASEKDPLGTTNATGGATTPNPFYNALTVIGEPYLDDSTHTNGTTAWYLFADQNMHDTFEVAFVDGQSAPYLESRDGWSVDGVEYKVRVEFGVSALDFRAMFRNKGA